MSPLYRLALSEAGQAALCLQIAMGWLPGARWVWALAGVVSFVSAVLAWLKARS